MDAQHDELYRVLVNHEDQYSLWRAGLPIPAGWRDTGISASEQECMAYVDRMWTDMCPLHLRKIHDQGEPIRTG